MKEGTKVTFRCKTEGAGDIAHGVVNGQSLTFEGKTFVPVWVDRRPDGREGTTVYVDARNIISEPK